jgi:glycosyltransferase involved in cell wall biosynthesis
LPTFNRREYLEISINSVLNQTFKDFELIIVNDGSTDETAEFLNQLQKLDNRIRCIHQTNQGLIKSLNNGISVAIGDYIARIDDDDFWSDSKKLEKQIDFLEKNPDYILIGSSGMIIFEADKKTIFWEKPITDKNIRKQMLFKCPFIHSSVIFRKEIVKRIGGYREECKLVEDWDLWMRLGKIGKMYNFPEVFVTNVVHGDNVSVQKNVQQIKNGIKIIKTHHKNYPNYFHALVYNYIKLLSFSLPLSTKILRKIKFNKNKKNK